jgi:hypothetical protein
VTTIRGLKTAGTEFWASQWLGLITGLGGQLEVLMPGVLGWLFNKKLAVFTFKILGLSKPKPARDKAGDPAGVMFPLRRLVW